MHYPPCPGGAFLATLAVFGLGACASVPRTAAVAETPGVRLPEPADAAPAAAPAADSATSGARTEAFSELDARSAPDLTRSKAQEAPPPSEDYENLYRKFNFAVGGALYGNFDTTVQVTETTTGIGAHLDMEDTLGIDGDSTTLRLDGQWGFNRRSRLNFSYYDIRRSGTRVAENDFTFGEITIPAGTTVNSEFDTLIFKLAYQYNFVADQRTTIGVTGGFHTMVIDVALESAIGDLEEQFKGTAPLPVIGLNAAYALSRKMKLAAATEFLQVEIQQLKGSIIDTKLTFEHDPFKHFGWGIGLNSFALDVELEGEDDLDADVEYGYSGLMIYLRTFF